MPGPQSPPHRLERNGTMAQDAFHRLDPRPRGRVKWSAFAFGSHTPASHPFARRGSTPLVRGGASEPCYLAATSAGLSADLAHDGEDASRRSLQPTFDTSTRGSPDSRARGTTEAARADRTSATDRSPLERAAPNRLATAQPRVATRLTTRHQLRRDHTPSRAADDDPRRDARSWRCHLTVAFSTACQVGGRSLTLPVAPRAAPFGGGPKTVGPLPPHARQSARPPWPEASSIDRCSLNRALARSIGWEPATVHTTLPPRAGFRRSFASPRSRLEGLDRRTRHELFTRDRLRPRAACRLLQPSTTREHNR